MQGQKAAGYNYVIRYQGWLIIDREPEKWPTTAIVTVLKSGKTILITFFFGSEICHDEMHCFDRNKTSFSIKKKETDLEATFLCLGN